MLAVALIVLLDLGLVVAWQMLARLFPSAPEPEQPVQTSASLGRPRVVR